MELSRYFVELAFADSDVRMIDLEPLLWGPMFEALLADYDLFRQVRVDRDAGTIVWPNGADISLGRCTRNRSQPFQPDLAASVTGAEDEGDPKCSSSC